MITFRVFINVSQVTGKVTCIRVVPTDNWEALQEASEMNPFRFSPSARYMLVIADGDYRSNPFVMFADSITALRSMVSRNLAIMRQGGNGTREVHQNLSVSGVTAGRIDTDTRIRGYVGTVIASASEIGPDGAIYTRRLYVRRV